MTDEREFTEKELLLLEMLEKLNSEAKKAGLDDDEAVAALRSSGMIDVGIKTAIGSATTKTMSDQEQLRYDFQKEMQEKGIRRGSHEMRMLYLKYRARGME